MSAGLLERVGGLLRRSGERTDNTFFIPELSQSTDFRSDPEFRAKIEAYRKTLPVRQVIERLWATTAFIDPKSSHLAQKIKFPLMASDLEAAPSLRRLLPSTLPPYFVVTVDAGKVPGWDGDNHLHVDNGEVTITIPKEAQPARPLRGTISIDASRFVHMRALDERGVSGELKFTRHFMGQEENLQAEGKDPVPVVEELIEVVSGLRKDFAEREAEFRVDHLTPQQEALVHTIEMWGLRWNNSIHYNPSRHEFLLGGVFDDEGSLQKFFLILTHANMGEEGITSPNLDGLEFPVKGSRRMLQRKISFDPNFVRRRVYQNDLLSADSNFVVRTEKGSRVLETIPVEVDEQNMRSYSWGWVDIQSFAHLAKFLGERAGLMPPSSGHILASSVLTS